jgi:hypothetical protein
LAKAPAGLQQLSLAEPADHDGRQLGGRHVVVRLKLVGETHDIGLKRVL